MDRIDTLAAIRAARRDTEAAHTRLQQMCRDADLAGVPISQIADAAQVARTTIYAWLRQEAS